MMTKYFADATQYVNTVLPLEKNVDLFKLIVEVSKIDRKAPSVELIEKVADTL